MAWILPIKERHNQNTFLVLSIIWQLILNTNALTNIKVQSLGKGCKF